ncbi:MAG: nucleoside hydrolase [Bryobacterales bacterium]|nr:nucleoside hydrolase [Bryobacterales bacterium]
MSNVLSTRRQALAAAALPALLPAQNAPDDATLRRLLEPPTGKVQVVIDTDTYNEIDDQYAVLYGLLSPDRIAVEAIYAAPYLNARSTSAADGMEKSYQEILRLLKFLGRDSKGMVFRGSESFLASAARPVESEAMRDLIAKALQPRSGPLYVLTLGCPANVASAILAEPKIKDKIVVVWLGGATHEWPSAREFNLFQDIHASRVLFDSGVPLMQIPTKNVSEHLRTTLPEAEFWLKGKSRLCDYLYEQFVDYYRTHTKGKPQPYPWSKVIWDISTVAWVLDPSWIPSALVPSPLLTDDFRWQKKPGRHIIRVATNALRDPVFHDLFTKLAQVK